MIHDLTGDIASPGITERISMLEDFSVTLEGYFEPGLGAVVGVRSRVHKVVSVWPWQYICDCGEWGSYYQWRNAVWYASKHVHIKHRKAP